MKGKITRIMGGVLALVMVFTLGAAFMPVNTPGGPAAAEAGDLTWSTVGPPSITSNVLVARNADLGPVAISPNFATDSTVWASVVDITTPATPIVYKSTDGGFTWSATTTVLGLAGDVVVDLKASPMYATDSTIFVVVQTPAGGLASGKVYRSVNGGSSFGQLGVVTLAGAEIITGFDVSPNYDGTGILAVSVASQTSNTAAPGQRPAAVGLQRRPVLGERGSGGSGGCGCRQVLTQLRHGLHPTGGSIPGGHRAPAARCGGRCLGFRHRRH